MAHPLDNTSRHAHPLAAPDVVRIDPIDLEPLFRIVLHGKLTILASITLAVVFAGYYAFAMAQPSYTSTATLEMKVASGPEIDLTNVTAGIVRDQADINTEREILHSRHLLEKLVETLDLTADPEFNRYLTPIPLLSVNGLRTTLRNAITRQREAPPDASAVLEKTIEHVAQAISASTLRDTYIMRINATTHSPKRSALLANTLAELYLADQVEAKYAANESAISWLSDRVYELQIQLETKETAVNAFISSAPVNDDAILEVLSRQSIETRERLSDLRLSLTQAQAGLLQLATDPDTLQTRTENSAPAPSTFRSDTTYQREKLANEVSRFTEQSKVLEEFQRQIEQQLQDQSEGLIHLQQLRREADATRALYETFLARLQEANIQRGLQHADSRILSIATAGKYIAPRKILILSLAALLGATLGTILVFGRHNLRRGFDTAKGLSLATGLPVFAQVPCMPIESRAQLVNYLQSEPSSAASEAIRNLRTSLLRTDPNRVPKVILSTSSIPGEGKTTNSIALAQKLAALGKKVLIIEADIRHGVFPQYFKSEQLGLTDVLDGRRSLQDVILHEPRLDIDVLTSQKTSQNPADLFAGSKFAGLIANVRGRYDFVILDAPPVLVVPDTRLLAQLADAILYTVRWETTDRDQVLAGKQELESVNAQITGLVLSQINTKQMHKYGQTYLPSYGRSYHQT